MCIASLEWRGEMLSLFFGMFHGERRGRLKEKGKKTDRWGGKEVKTEKRDKKERRENVSESTQTQDFNSPL